MRPDKPGTSLDPGTSILDAPNATIAAAAMLPGFELGTQSLQFSASEPLAGAVCPTTWSTTGCFVVIALALALVFLDRLRPTWIAELHEMYDKRQQKAPDPNQSATITGQTAKGAKETADASQPPSSDGATKKADSDAADASGAPSQLAPGVASALAFLTLSAWVADAYYGMLAVFLPGVAEQRNVSPTASNAIFAMQALGVVCVSAVMPWVLQHPKVQPYRLILLATIINSAVIAAGGLAQQHITSDRGFVIYMAGNRFLQGCVVAVQEVCLESITFFVIPRELLGQTIAVLQAARMTSALFGPSIGGVLYGWGCWPAPFLVCSSVLLAAGLLMGIGTFKTLEKEITQRKANSELSPLKLLMIPGFILLQLAMVPPVLGITMLEPLMQPFLGAAPFSLSPAQIGAFNIIEIVVIVVMMPASAAIAPCARTFSPPCPCATRSSTHAQPLREAGPTPIDPLTHWHSALSRPPTHRFRLPETLDYRRLHLDFGMLPERAHAAPALPAAKAVDHRDRAGPLGNRRRHGERSPTQHPGQHLCQVWLLADRYRGDMCAHSRARRARRRTPPPAPHVPPVMPRAVSSLWSFLQASVAFVGPLISGPLIERMTFPWITTWQGIVTFVTFTPIVVLLCKDFADTPKPWPCLDRGKGEAGADEKKDEEEAKGK
jgi:hypothetical protein